MRIVRLPFVIILFASAACTAGVDPTPFTGPSGKQAYSMRCSGFGRDWDDCYVEAGKLCPQGYNIVDQATGTVAVPYGGSVVAAPKQTLVVECK